MELSLFLFILGILMFIEGIILFLFSSKVNTLLGSFFKNQKILEVKNSLCEFSQISKNQNTPIIS